MGNAVLAYKNRVDEAALSGGSWMASLPLANLQNRGLKVVARSIDLLPASTKFVMDQGDSSTLISFIAICGHKLSGTAKYRVRGGQDSTFATSLFDTGWQDAWTRVYNTADLDWRALNWWSGRLLDEDKQGYTWNIPIHIGLTVYYRYWLFEFDDSARADGVAYVDIGRIFASSSMQPVVNIEEGASVGWETKTDVQESLSGAETFQPRQAYRVAVVSLGYMLDTEAFSKAFEMQRLSGLDKEVFFIRDPNDTLQAFRTQFLGRMQKLNPVTLVNYLLRKTAFEIKELI